MPITVQCDCGKRMALSDVLAGRTVKCSSCGDEILVPAKSKEEISAAVKTKDADPGIYISTGKIVAAVSVVVFLILFAIVYFGPLRVWRQWDDIGGKANDNVTDVLTFALQAYLSQEGGFNPNESHSMPAVDSPVQFIRPTLAMSMPEKIQFMGKNNQGDYKGYYHPRTGEIEADVAYGGRSFAGTVDLAKATGQFHMTGREIDGQPQAEVDGQPLKIVAPPPMQLR
jgi:DNA-directed RNA polymerase subunit RPC12/RpoP